MRYALKELCLEVTNCCPMECKHCSSRSVQVGKAAAYHMPLSTAKRVIKEFCELGGCVLELSGGEPLIYPGLHGLCEYAAGLGLEVRLYTSGISLGQENRLLGLTASDALELKRGGVEKIIFNIEGATSITHETITGVTGSHNLALMGVKNSKKAGLWVGVHFVPMKPNFNEFADVASLCRSIGVDELALLRFVPQGRGLDNRDSLELDTHEFKTLLLEVINLKNKYSDLRIRVGCPMDFVALYDSSIPPHQCKAGRSTALITPDGYVLPCPGFKNSEAFRAGNINRESLASIWNASFKLLRDFDYEKISGPCKVCSFLRVCAGRCAAQRYVSTGDIYRGPDPLCPKVLEEPIENWGKQSFLAGYTFLKGRGFLA